MSATATGISSRLIFMCLPTLILEILIPYPNHLEIEKVETTVTNIATITNKGISTTEISQQSTLADAYQKRKTILIRIIDVI